MQLCMAFVAVLLVTPYTLASSSLVEGHKLHGRTGEDPKDPVPSIIPTSSSTIGIPAKDQFTTSLPPKDLISGVGQMPTVPAKDLPSLPTLWTVPAKDETSSTTLEPSMPSKDQDTRRSIPPKDLKSYSSFTTVPLKDLSTSVTTALSSPAKDQTGTSVIPAKDLTTHIASLQTTPSVTQKDQIYTIPPKDQTSTVPAKDLTSLIPKDQVSTLPAKDQTGTSNTPLKDMTTTITSLVATPSTTQEGQINTIPLKDQTSTVPTKDQTSSIPQKDQVSTLPAKDQPTSLPAKDQTGNIPLKDESSTTPVKGLPTTIDIKSTSVAARSSILPGSRSASATAVPTLSSPAITSIEVSATATSEPAATLPVVSSSVSRADIESTSGMVSPSDSKLASQFLGPTTANNPSTSMVIIVSTSTLYVPSLPSDSTMLHMPLSSPSEMSETEANNDSSFLSPSSASASVASVTTTNLPIMTTVSTLTTNFVTPSLLGTDSATLLSSLSPAATLDSSPPAMTNASVLTSASESTRGTLTVPANLLIAVASTAPVPESTDLQGTTTALSNQQLVYLGALLTTTTMVSPAYSAPNSNGTTVPLWLPDMLGNAYGGGFVRLPSVYVIVTPSPTIGIPPGYGFSLKPGESTPIYSLTIAPKPTYPTASGGYVVLSSGTFGTSSTGIGQQLTLTSGGNGSYAVPTVPAVFQGTAPRLSMMMTAVVGTFLLGLTLL